jgi:hypothetical protein
MTRKDWKKIIPHVVRKAGIASECPVVTLDASSEELAWADRVLATFAPRYSLLVSAILAGWREHGAYLLLETLPQLLNPDVASADLTPTGRSTRVVFPDLYRVLERTEDIAIIVDPAEGGALELVGRTGRSIPAKVDEIWAYEAPKPIGEITRWEVERDIHLSPQMKQLYMRVGGARSNWIYPCFYRLEEMRRGSLFTDVYQDILDQVPLGAATIERMRQFVVLSDDGAGNSEGFFADDWQAGSEYTIYDWNHETSEFDHWTQDFAVFVAGWLRPDE